jgi:predicted metal-dependent hydrolase
MGANVQIRPQARKSLAMKVTPGGVQVLIPQGLAADSPEVQDFIREGLQKLAPPVPVPAAECLDRVGLLTSVQEWADRLGVQVRRVQLRQMRNKWGSVSTAGNLTLARDLLRLPRELAEYVICHELLHLRVAGHNRVYRLLLGRYIPDWREREEELGRWALVLAESGVISVESIEASLRLQKP